MCQNSADNGDTEYAIGLAFSKETTDIKDFGYDGTDTDSVSLINFYDENFSIISKPDDSNNFSVIKVSFGVLLMAVLLLLF